MRIHSSSQFLLPLPSYGGLFPAAPEGSCSLVNTSASLWKSFFLRPLTIGCQSSFFHSHGHLAEASLSSFDLQLPDRRVSSRPHSLLAPVRGQGQTGSGSNSQVVPARAAGGPSMAGCIEHTDLAIWPHLSPGNPLGGPTWVILSASCGLG